AFAPADPDIELVINGANYAIAGESIEPLLRFEDANEVYINELTVTNEFGIGIMIENSRVSLSYSTVSDNQNDGIRIKEGSLLVFASTIASNGGDAVSASL